MDLPQPVGPISSEKPAGIFNDKFWFDDNGVFLDSFSRHHHKIDHRHQLPSKLLMTFIACLHNDIGLSSLIHSFTVLSIKSKKYVKPIQDYLTEEELETLFNSVDTSTSKGLRNLAILVLLYDTAARANEIINLKAEDLRLEEKLVILK